MRVHSHYENLRVSRDAPPEVIRAAYRALSQLHHPDRRPDDLDAAKKMAILNRAFETLSNPLSRTAHNHWIEEQEYEPTIDELAEADQIVENSTRPVPQVKPLSWWVNIATTSRKHAFAFGLLGFVILYPLINFFLSGFPSFPETNLSTPSASDPQYSSMPINNRPATFRTTVPLIAPARSVATSVSPPRLSLLPPNGAPWPERSGYLTGYPVLHQGGLSTLTINNGGGGENLFIKLVSIESDGSYPVRHVFVSSFSRFTMRNVLAGEYVLRYRNLTGGPPWSTPTFSIQENREVDLVNFTELTLTLFKVSNGNLHTVAIREDQF